MTDRPPATVDVIFPNYPIRAGPVVYALPYRKLRAAASRAGLPAAAYILMPETCFIIPCFNHGRFVREAVDSCLTQQDADVAVVIVNDGSTDGHTPAACDACRSERVAVIHQENRGLSGARNRGAAEAARLFGPRFLAFLDADDYVRPTFVKALTAAITGALAAGQDQTSHAYCQEELTELGTGTWRVPEWDPLLLMVTNLHPVTTLVRRDRFEAVGGFDETMRDGYEDWDFWLKFSERGWRGVRVREPLFVWRRHSHTTMVMEAVKRHDDLYRQIRSRHASLYARHAEEVLTLSNSLLRKFDANWIDETGYPIQLQFLQKSYDELLRVRMDVARLAQELDQVRRQAAEQRGWYEGFAAVKLHHALHRAMDRLPGPLSTGAKWFMTGVRRLIVGSPAAPTPPATTTVRAVDAAPAAQPRPVSSPAAPRIVEPAPTPVRERTPTVRPETSVHG